ncbi:E3 ubiquitin-protein ligase Siah1 [Orchesella cincta]|uniref:RING-type E3 ubiquitin transferase n=1 Tax=Orchesella cincta TaxID=48709 RepID=A0A1D2MI46_ORCCI|nr:E3 ubiquitin-protein ligase Siah1 [Orchesella cincta]
MEDNQQCPICMDIPEKEIYQCVRGHTICHTCIANLVNCPQCREPYGNQRIRNLALEQILDQLTFDCVHLERGCTEKLKRQDISKHAEICTKKELTLCKALGYLNCNFLHNEADPRRVINHLVDQHSALSEFTSRIIVWFTDFSSAIQTSTNTKWNPILITVNEEWCKNSTFMIFGSVDVNRKVASWTCLQLCSSLINQKDIYEAEFTLVRGEEKERLFKCRIPIHKLQDISAEDLMKNCPVEIPLVLVEKFCPGESNIATCVEILHSKYTKIPESKRQQACESKMDDHLKCPICFEIPEKEIYQCASGHTICDTCSSSLKLCPQCREPYGTKKIRNRALEQILDSQSFDCNFKEKGCKEKLKRQNITKHSENCPFDKKPINICKILGYSWCSHVIDTGNPAQTAKHFEDKHGAVIECGNEVIIWHAHFQSAIDAIKSSRWTQILLKVDKPWCRSSLFLIVGKIDVRREIASWICIQFCGKGKLEIEFAIEDIADSDKQISKLPPYRWTVPIININDDAVQDCLDCCPVNISLKFMEKLCRDKTDIPISVLIQPTDESLESQEDGIPEVWAFSKQIKRPLYLCKTLGFSTCIYVLNSADRNNVIKHFEEHHFSVRECSNKIVTWHTDFISAVEATKNQTWNPAILNTDGGWCGDSMFMIVRSVDVTRKSASWMCLQICVTSENTFYEAEFTLLNGEAKKPVVGKRHKCLQCSNYDLCENCMAAGTHAHHVFVGLPTPEQVATSSSASGVICPNINCDGCLTHAGKQYKCLQCPDYDLCLDCMSRGRHAFHVFAIVTTFEQRQIMRQSFRLIR